MDEQKQPESQLSAVFPNSSVELSDGRKVAIHKIKMKYIKRVLDLLRNILKGLMEDSKSPADLFTMISDKQSLATPDMILQLISNNWEDAFELISLHTELSVTEIGEYEIDDGLVLIAGVLRKNADFFVEKVLPLLGALAQEAEVARNNPLSQKSNVA